MAGGPADPVGVIADLALAVSVYDRFSDVRILLDIRRHNWPGRFIVEYVRRIRITRGIDPAATRGVRCICT